MSRARENADGARLDAPLASPTFTGTVAIPNVANLETAVVANTAKVTNYNQTLADINALDITELGTVTSANFNTLFPFTSTAQNIGKVRIAKYTGTTPATGQADWGSGSIPRWYQNIAVSISGFKSGTVPACFFRTEGHNTHESVWAGGVSVYNQARCYNSSFTGLAAIQSKPYTVLVVGEAA